MVSSAAISADKEPTVVEYADYRKFLRDFYDKQKSRNPSFSYRLFAQRAKLSSPNYLKLVIDGSRRITDKTLPNFVRGLRLNSLEAQYFRSLVFYQETTDPEAKGAHLQEICTIRQRAKSSLCTLDRDRIEMLRHWHHWVIRELVLLADFKAEPEWIAKRLRSKITPAQAKESLELLERTGLLKKDEHGKLLPTDLHVTTGDDISSLILKNVHREFLGLATESLMNDTGDMREICGLTILVEKARLPQMKEMIREFRKELDRTFTQKHVDGEVYQFNVALYPLTLKRSER